MIELSDAEIPRSMTVEEAAVGSSFSEDAAWLTAMATVIVLEVAWWAVAWSIGMAPAPYIFTYLALAFVGLGAALMIRLVLQPRAGRPNWSNILPATVLVGLGASLFLPLKYAIPKLLPFWLDAPLAHAEKTVFGADPWLLLDRCVGWAAVPMDRLYSLWLPTQALFLFYLMMQPGSPAKSRALIAYVLAWFLLGVTAAILFSSAGPIFYGRLFGGTAFAGLRESLRHRGAWVVLTESDKMWASLASGRPGIVAGISAVPSIHVAISVWMFLTARIAAPRAASYVAVYTALIWIGSVQLGWHYVTDGLAGMLGMLAIWSLSRSVETKLRSFVVRSDAEAHLQRPIS
jgi:hypothetical protein